MPSPATVLLYHDVTDAPRPQDAAWTVAPAVFAAHVRALADSGAPALAVAEIAEHLRTRRAFAPRSFAVTFDDGYASQAESAAVLAAAGIPCTVYMTADFVGRRGYLDAAALRALADIPGVAIGAHGTSHAHLDVLTPPHMRADIDHSARVLEQHIGRAVDAFAYPHGSFDRRVRAHLAAGGWRSGAAVKNARTHEGDDPYAFARVSVVPSVTSAQVLALLDGHGAPLAWTRERLRTTVYRQVRRVRHRIEHR